jgi:hypothetical protein
LTHKALEVLELVHCGFEDGNSTRPMVWYNFANIFDFLWLWQSIRGCLLGRWL